MSEKREMSIKQSKGLSVQDILLVGILLAAGAVLKFFVSSFIPNFGFKPNFIISMYCLSILIIKPSILEALIIGVLAGVVCQFFPGTPYLNLFSETIGGLVMALLLLMPFDLEFVVQTGKFQRYSLKPAITTAITTLFSGFSFMGLMYLMVAVGAPVKAIPVMFLLTIIFTTTAANAIIVQLLYIPLKLALRKD